MLAQTSNFAVWLGSGSFLALQFMKLDLLVFDPVVRLWVAKVLSMIVVGCCVLSGYRLGTYLNTSKQVIKDAIKREIEEDAKNVER